MIAAVLSQALGRSPEEVAQALERVVERNNREESSALREALEWFAELFGSEAILNVWEGFFWLFLFVLLVIGSIFLARFMRPAWMRSPAEPLEEERKRVEDRVRALLAEAEEARARGDLRLALRRQLFALVLGLGRRGDLRYHDAWTNRELLRRGQPTAEVQALLAPLLDELEAKEFGSEPVSLEDVDRMQALCVQHLGASAGRAA